MRVIYPKPAVQPVSLFRETLTFFAVIALGVTAYVMVASAF